MCTHLYFLDWLTSFSTLQSPFPLDEAVFLIVSASSLSQNPSGFSQSLSSFISVCLTFHTAEFLKLPLSFLLYLTFYPRFSLPVSSLVVTWFQTCDFSGHHFADNSQTVIPSPHWCLSSGRKYSTDFPTCEVGQHSNLVRLKLKLGVLRFFSNSLPPSCLAMAMALSSFRQLGWNLRVNPSLTSTTFVSVMISFGFIILEPLPFPTRTRV